MTFKAPPEMQALGSSVEIRVRRIIEEAVLQRLPDAHVMAGDPNSRYNAEFGVCRISPMEGEAPLVCIEIKGSTYPASFSISDNEKRTSQCLWVVVDGPDGIWCCTMYTAQQFLSEKSGDNGKYWVCTVPIDRRMAFASMINSIVAVLQG